MKKVLTNLLLRYPAMMFMSVDLPAPDGPMIAVSSPDLNLPDTPYIIDKKYYAAKTKAQYHKKPYTHPQRGITKNMKCGERKCCKI
jgi:hypothetical protein